MKKLLKKRMKKAFAKVSLYVSENCEADQLTFFTDGCCR